MPSLGMPEVLKTRGKLIENETETRKIGLHEFVRKVYTIPKNILFFLSLNGCGLLIFCSLKKIIEKNTNCQFSYK